MAIINDQGQLISYNCPELIEDIKQDCEEFRRSKTVYAACKVLNGVKIVFDYLYDPNDEEEMQNFPPLKEDEWLEKTTLGKLLAYATEQNNLTDEYSTINELYDASGMSITEFAEYFSVPLRTMQNWIYGKREVADYILKLMNSKLKNEKRNRIMMNIYPMRDDEYMELRKAAKNNHSLDEFLSEAGWMDWMCDYCEEDEDLTEAESDAINKVLKEIYTEVKKEEIEKAAGEISNKLGEFLVDQFINELNNAGFKAYQDDYDDETIVVEYDGVEAEAVLYKSSNNEDKFGYSYIK